MACGSACTRPRRQVASTLAASKYFRMMYVTDEAVASDSSPLLAPCELRFQFVLPAAGKMEELTPLMHLAVSCTLAAHMRSPLFVHLRSSLVHTHRCTWSMPSARCA